MRSKRVWVSGELITIFKRVKDNVGEKGLEINTPSTSKAIATLLNRLEKEKLISIDELRVYKKAKKPSIFKFEVDNIKKVKKKKQPYYDPSKIFKI